MNSVQAGYLGSLRADALALPVHWYYDRDALDRDYPILDGTQDPLPQHPDSIFWRSEYEVTCSKDDILHDQAPFWGVRGVHYHQQLKAGDNTANFQLARELHEQVNSAGKYDAAAWLELYIHAMLTPDWHRDTYLEEYHRGFFKRYAAGKAPEKCGIKDEHIGGLAQVPALVAALPELPIDEIKAIVKEHVALTHRHSNVLRAADCLTRLLRLIEDGTPLREALMNAAGDWLSTRKATGWEKRPDRVIIGTILSPACYIDQAFPAALYLAWKYHDDLDAAILANARVGGDSCHRGAVIGSLVGANYHRAASD
ncbi:ADP-ribosylglycohydrolase family protein [Akkermansiaceae bacterium]|nr:ADP-ribosylglycohydrolase family protein [Akkermansiaceae bacterium]